MRTHAEFSVRQIDHGKRIVWIVDHDNGGCSVTNAAEGVCAFMNERYPGFRIIYRDSDGYWDELVHVDGVFSEFKSARELGLP
jgi:hypothetical protein